MTQNWTLIVESNWIFSKLYIYIYIYIYIYMDLEKHLYILKMVSDWQHGSN